MLAFAAIAPGHADELPEYRLKAAFIYNFAVFTEWPAAVEPVLQLCILGPDPFGAEIDGLQGKPVGERKLAVQRRARGEALDGCHVVYAGPTVVAELPRLLEPLKGRPLLSVADQPGALRHGVVLNMAVVNKRVAFEASLPAARAAGLGLSSRLLRLATEVVQ